MFSSARRFAVNGKTGSISSSRVATQSRSAAKSSAATKETSNLFGTYGLGNMLGASGLNVHASGPINHVGMLSYLVPQQEDMLRTYYRDIYYYDPVCGAAVDLLSSFPFSEFNLIGCDQEILNKYEESLARLNIRALMPDISTTYLVDAVFTASLIFNKRDKVFIDLIVYPADDCKVDPVPFYSADPTIIVRNNQQMTKFMTSHDSQNEALKRLLPENLRQTLQSKAFKLDPLTTLHISRRTLPGAEPTSFLKRVLPIYLLEKTLYRGTLVEAMKRQRSMLHVQMGDDTHEFTPEEMAEVVNQFQLADLDPLGAVIGTRNNVQATELRQGGDFWKVTDTIDILTPYKLRALGISEAFLSGDSNYSNVETALSVFMENADAYRSFLTYETFTNKIFPIVAIHNNFYKKGREQNIHNRSQMLYQANNSTDLEIPIVRWHKQLAARDEDNLLDTLTTLEEKGFPIPLRMWAAAGKIDLNAYYQDLAEDNEVKQKIAAYQKAAGATQEGESEGEGEDGMEFSSLRSLTKPIHRVNMLERDFGDASEMTASTKTGKKKWVYNQRAASKQANDAIMRAVLALSDPHVKQKALAKVKKQNRGVIPNMLGVPKVGRR